MKRSLVVVMAVLTLGTGCQKIKDKLTGKAEEKAVETTTGGEVSSSSGSVNVKSDKGTVAVESDKAPADWPADIPPYPGAKITTSMAAPNGKTMVMQTTDPTSKVHDFYKGKLSGMKQLSDTKLGGMNAMSFKDGKRVVSITMTGDAPVQITVSISGA